MILAIVLLSASCQAKITIGIDRQRADLMSVEKLAMLHDDLIDCGKEEMTIPQMAKYVSTAGLVSSYLFSRAMEYLDTLRLREDFLRQPAKVGKK